MNPFFFGLAISAVLDLPSGAVVVWAMGLLGAGAYALQRNGVGPELR